MKVISNDQDLVDLKLGTKLEDGRIVLPANWQDNELIPITLVLKETGGNPIKL